MAERVNNTVGLGMMVKAKDDAPTDPRTGDPVEVEGDPVAGKKLNPYLVDALREAK